MYRSAKVVSRPSSSNSSTVDDTLVELLQEKGLGLILRGPDESRRTSGSRMAQIRPAPWRLRCGITGVTSSAGSPVMCVNGERRARGMLG